MANKAPQPVSPLTRVVSAYAHLLRCLVMVLAALAALAVLAMMLITCADVIMRIFRSTFKGAYDLVKIAGALALAGALPYTTAIKGHVAIEYFFQKLNRPGRVVVDTLCRIVTVGLFGLLGWQCIQYGLSLKATGQVTATLQVPVFWVPWFLAASCFVVMLVILHNLLHPGKEMIKP